jgi:NAD(P)H dehydrogenase (quinone)
MTKILVVYDSKTGNTEKMAFAVAEGAKQIKGVEVVVKKVEQASVEDFLGVDGIIMGSPTYYGQMSAKLKALIDESVKIHGKLKEKLAPPSQAPVEQPQVQKPLYYLYCKPC